jgi:hypothetical protein
MLLEDRVSAESGQQKGGPEVQKTSLHPELTSQPQEEWSQPLDEKSQLQYEKNQSRLQYANSQFRDDQRHKSSLMSEITRVKDEL